MFENSQSSQCILHFYLVAYQSTMRSAGGGWDWRGDAPEDGVKVSLS
jgi:hypothetical protein